MEHYFNIKVWVKNYFGLNTNDKTLENTNNSLEFIWVWSIFEHKYLRNSRNYKSFNDQIVEIAVLFPIKKIDVNNIYGFFYNRYFQKGKTTRFFGNLNFEDKWKKIIVEILKKTEPTEIEKLKVVLLIIYKFRCNLFHGKKDPLLWKNFDVVFYNINKFLADFLDKKITLKIKKN